MVFTGCAGGIFVAPQSNSFCKSLIQGMPSITAMILSKSIRGKTQMSALWQAGLMEYQIEYPQFYGLHCVCASGVLLGSIILLLGCSILKFGHICEQKSATDGAVSVRSTGSEVVLPQKRGSIFCPITSRCGCIRPAFSAGWGRPVRGNAVSFRLRPDQGKGWRGTQPGCAPAWRGTGR